MSKKCCTLRFRMEKKRDLFVRFSGPGLKKSFMWRYLAGCGWIIRLGNTWSIFKVWRYSSWILKFFSQREAGQNNFWMGENGRFPLTIGRQYAMAMKKLWLWSCRWAAAPDNFYRELQACRHCLSMSVNSKKNNDKWNGKRLSMPKFFLSMPINLIN